MLTVSIDDLRSLERARFTIDRLTLVTARNGQGKTSLLSGIAWAITGTALPPWLLKKNAGALVRRGAEQATVGLQWDGGSVEVTYPKAEVTFQGDRLPVSPVAAGLLSIPDMEAKNRAPYLAQLLKTAPTKQDVAEALTDIGKAKALDKLWTALEQDGWDSVHARAREHGTKTKGQWEQIAGGKYGAEKAANWKPQAWTDDLADETEETLLAAVETARQATEKKVAGQAVDASKRADLAVRAGRLDKAQADHQDAVETVTRLETEIKAARDEREKLGEEAPADGVACPCCGEKIAINRKGGEIKLEKIGKKPSDAALKKDRERRAALDGGLKRLDVQKGDAETARDAAQKTIGDAKAAQKELAAVSSEGSTAEEIAAARAAEETANIRLKAWRDRRDAEAKHQIIASNQTMIDLLAPEGLRKRRTAKVIETFNAQFVAPVCAAAKWRPVLISEDLEIRYGGQPYALLSESEQMRVRVTLQIAAAKLDGSKLLLIDRADILDQQGRGGLIDALKDAAIPSVVAMTYSAENKAPNLAGIGGQTLWIDDGRVRPLDAQARKAA